MPTILVVEDNPADVVLLKHAFEAAGVLWDCWVARDGQAAMDYLGEGLDSGTLPQYVLLDLKLPRRSGLEVLAWMRTLEPLRAIRVIVFTSSSSDEDRANAERFGIEAYATKPANLEEYRKAVRRIAEVWNLRRSTPPVFNPQLAPDTKRPEDHPRLQGA